MKLLEVEGEHVSQCLIAGDATACTPCAFNRLCTADNAARVPFVQKLENLVDPIILTLNDGLNFIDTDC